MTAWQRTLRGLRGARGSLQQGKGAGASSLVGLLGVGPIGALATIVGLDGEGVLLLGLAVHWLLGPDQSFSRRFVQDHSLKGHPRPMEPEATDLTWPRWVGRRLLHHLQPPLPSLRFLFHLSPKTPVPSLVHNKSNHHTAPTPACLSSNLSEPLLWDLAKS